MKVFPEDWLKHGWPEVEAAHIDKLLQVEVYAADWMIGALFGVHLIVQGVSVHSSQKLQQHN